MQVISGYRPRAARIKTTNHYIKINIINKLINITGTKRTRFRASSREINNNENRRRAGCLFRGHRN
ncbi:hypothetical protein CWM57_07110 [Klebsiella sp. G-Nf4]|nr:hypothetical protein CWM64_08935 [Klebsiella sp. I-Nf8]PJX33915.1 hypothetical protein CWM53_01515 [Klebsiella sp. A-Nf5]PJX35742.1 hypothetical protein CWM59_21635 [Klebsiella sp. B-Nf7]PJX48933.1 hypothetical protein CWM60_08925 [Klebsiella sp. C1-16S-Nf17]PJX70853.1 hypothetical protein CWM57_07110 [Klebsiella sp. G-Nf4]PJX75569.1 hypothetical protein CWM55_09340 [Klebsiella sp. G2-16S-Nf13]PKJ75187.1 hypothetical protein CWM65_13835 [Klebsiella sp. J-Nf11]